MPLRGENVERDTSTASDDYDDDLVEARRNSSRDRSIKVTRSEDEKRKKDRKRERITARFSPSLFLR
jgi:hypothetical protein